MSKAIEVLLGMTQEERMSLFLDDEHLNEDLADAFFTANGEFEVYETGAICNFEQLEELKEGDIVLIRNWFLVSVRRKRLVEVCTVRPKPLGPRSKVVGPKLYDRLYSHGYVSEDEFEDAVKNVRERLSKFTAASKFTAIGGKK